MNKIFTLIVVIALVLSLTGCDDTGRYTNDYLELHVIATNSILGVHGWQSDRVIVLDEDDFGRKMFSFIGSSLNAESLNGKVLSVLISQKTTETDSYFYDGVNSIFIEKDDVEFNYKMDQKMVYDNFSNEQLEELKVNNDWGKEIEEDKLFKVKIRRKKLDTVSLSNQRNVFGSVSNDFHVAYRALLTTDKNGKSLYYMRGRTYDDVSKEYIFTKSYIFMLYKDGTLVGENAVEEVTDFWNYQDQLAAFKKANGWNGSSK